MTAIDWNKEFRPLLKKYKQRKHPLEYKSHYQLLVMVLLAAQTSDEHINQLAPALFRAFPDMSALAKANEAALMPYVSKVRNFRNKIKWLITLASDIKHDRNIPDTMDELTALPGIGRKSANVIMREMGKPAVGIIVDLHVVRVAPRLGIASGTDPKQIEKQLMDTLNPAIWGEIGMALSFLGRDICRPRNPQHDECVMKDVCAYCRKMNQ